MESMIFTMDVEDWYHSENIKPWLHKSYSSHTSTSKVELVLKILSDKGAFGTFFFLGRLAQEVPSLVREVASAGHEIANHGWNHEILTNMTFVETTEDLKKSTTVLEDITNEKVQGYRSPCFSQNPYIFDVLRSLGYTYTSMGIESTFHNRYANNIVENDDSLPDFGLPVARFFGAAVPCSGGGWFRFFPVSFQQWLLQQSESRPKVFYCHPWDFDGDQPFLDRLPRSVRWRHSYNASVAGYRLSALNFGQTPLSSLID